MPETAILNPTVRWRKDIDDSIGPDFGWERLRPSQLATVKPAFGRPWQRTVGNGGHRTTFSWINRSRKCIELLKQWAEQYEDGFFTIIDHDGGGRHYVGNFVGDMPQAQGRNDSYTVQGWAFEEIPGCPMVEYPSDWDHWAVTRAPFDDYGDQKTATQGIGWMQPASVGGAPQPAQLVNLAPAAGDNLLTSDWIQHEYTGYGFRLWAGIGPQYGQAHLYVDGMYVEDLQLNSSGDQGVGIAYENAAMPLGVHRVKVYLVGAGANSGMLWDRIEVMR